MGPTVVHGNCFLGRKPVKKENAQGTAHASKVDPMVP